MSKPKKAPFRNTIRILSVVAIFSVAVAIYAFYNLSTFVAQAERAKGTIVGFEKQRKVFKPVITFRTAEGDSVTFTTVMGSEDTMLVKTGSKVKVLYYPEAPENAVLESERELWFPPAMILLFGVGPLIFILILRAILVPKPNEHPETNS